MPALRVAAYQKQQFQVRQLHNDCGPPKFNALLAGREIATSRVQPREAKSYRKNCELLRIVKGRIVNAKPLLETRSRPVVERTTALMYLDPRSLADYTNARRFGDPQDGPRLMVQWSPYGGRSKQILQALISRTNVSGELSSLVAREAEILTAFFPCHSERRFSNSTGRPFLDRARSF
jgi:hypothetical protein